MVQLKVNDYWKSGIGYVAALLLTLFMIPHFMSISQYRIPPSQISIVGENPGVIPQPFIAGENTTKMLAQHRPRQTETRRFHFSFDENDPVSGPRQIYIPTGGSEMRAFINGIPLPISEPNRFFAPGFGRSWIHSDIERWMLLPGKNSLDLHVHRDDARSGIPEVYFGPSKTVGAVADQQKRWMKRLPNIVLLVGTFIMIISVLGLIYASSKRSYLVSGCLGCLLVMQAGMSQITGYPGIDNADLAMRFFFPFCIVLLILLLQIYDRDHWEGLSASKIALYGFALTGPFLALAQLILPFAFPASIYFATLALLTPMPLLAAGSALNIVQDLKIHRTKLEALSEKVSEQAEELDEQSQLIAKAMRTKAVLEERQRFTRDIHDGIGGQLLSLLLRVRTGSIPKEEIAREIQAGLDDLRLVVDSMDHTGDNLEAALTTFKIRAINQLQAARVKLDWDQSEAIHITFPNTRGTLHLFRFMQEAITNIIKHSEATRAQISLNQPAEFAPLTVTIADNGVGFSPEKEQTSSGRGMRNLETRATHLGGTLTFESGLEGKGTGLRLVIPDHPGPSSI